MKERLWKTGRQREIRTQIESKRLKEEACRDVESHCRLFSPIFTMSKKRITDQHTDQQTNGGTYPLIDMHGSVYKVKAPFFLGRGPSRRQRSVWWRKIPVFLQLHPYFPPLRLALKLCPAVPKTLWLTLRLPCWSSNPSWSTWTSRWTRLNIISHWPSEPP